MKFKIYALVDPTNQQIKYVGKTVIALSARLANHIYKARSYRTQTPVGVWIRTLLDQTLRPQIRLLEESEAEPWQSREKFWINKLRIEASLLNINDGGNGAHTRRTLPEEFIPLLGNISDHQIAERANLSREAIGYHRRRLGVRSAPRDKSRLKNCFVKGQIPYNRFQASPDIASLLGHISDTDLCIQAGVSRHTLGRVRRNLGIPTLKQKLRKQREIS